MRFKLNIALFATLFFGFSFGFKSFAQTWENQSVNTSDFLAAIHFTDKQNGWVVTKSGKVFHTSDSGNQWDEQQTPTDGQMSDICFINQNYGWYVGGYAKIVHTNDGGETWEEQPNPGNCMKSVHFVDSNNGWAVGCYAVVLHTNDGGETWERQSNNASDLFNDVHFVDSNHGYIVGINGNLLISEDGGKNWTIPQTNNVGSRDLRSVYFVNKDTGWAVGDGLLHTTDGGQSWTTQSLGTNVRDIYDVKFISDKIGWVSASNGKMFHTRNGGKNWQQQTTNYDRAITNISIVPNSMIGWGTRIGSKGGLVHNKGYNKKVSLLSPSDNAKNISLDPAFSWGNASDSAKYELQVAEDRKFSSIVEEEKAISDSVYELSESLKASTYYYWRVRPINPLGFTGRWSDIYTFQTGSNTYIESSQNNDKFLLEQNHPNPFRRQTNIEYILPKNAHVRLTVFNQYGTKVATLINKKKRSGKHTLRYEPIHLSTGFYFYRLETDKITRFKKMQYFGN